MPIFKFIVSLSNAITTYSPQTFDIEIITTLRKHRQSDPDGTRKPQITIYASDKNPYLPSYTSFDDPNNSDLSQEYRDDVEECFRNVIRAFGIYDNEYDVEVKHHPNVHRMYSL